MDPLTAVLIIVSYLLHAYHIKKSECRITRGCCLSDCIVTPTNNQSESTTLIPQEKKEPPQVEKFQ